MKNIKNENIRKPTFQDAFFVRAKIKNSITCPKFHRTPNFSQNVQKFHNSLLHTNLKEPFIQRVKKSKIKPSEYEVNQQSTKNLKQFKQIMERQNRKGQPYIKDPTTEDKIFLRTSSQVNLIEIQKSKNMEKINTKSQNEEQVDKLLISRKLSFTRKQGEKYVYISQSQNKMNQKWTVFPVLLKIRQINNKNYNFEHSFNGEKSINKSEKSEDEKLISAKKRSTGRLFFEQNRTQRSLIVESTQQTEFQEEKLNKTFKSFIQQRKQISEQLQTFKSPLYQHKFQAPEPIKKYSHKQLSTKKQNFLLNKYKRLENRLENLLLQARVEKDRKNKMFG